MKKSGFTLIEIMVTIAIVAILAVVAFPNYQRYVLKAKLADVMAYADTAKLAFTEYYEETGMCPTVKHAGLKETSPIPHIANVSQAWDKNPCEKWVEFYLTIDGDSEPALNDLDGERVMMRGYLKGDGVIEWKCGFSRYTTDIKSYLPASCQEELL